jgi:hypothetical protein
MLKKPAKAIKFYSDTPLQDCTPLEIFANNSNVISKVNSEGF